MFLSLKEQINLFQIIVCETVVSKFTLFTKYKKDHFFIWVSWYAHEWYILYKSQNKRLFSWRCWVVSAMIRNYFWVIHITIGKTIVENTQPAQNDPGTSKEGPLNVLTYNLQGNLHRTLRGLSGDQYKIDDFMKKLFFRSNSPCVTYLVCFTGRTNIQKL